MANFCHQCAQPVTALMRVCPQCGALLAAPSAGAAQPGYAPPVAQTGAPPGYVPAVHAAPFPPDSYAADLLAATVTGYPKAPLGSRFIASLIDSFIGFAAMLPGVALLALGGTAEIGALSAVGGIVMFAGIVWTLYYTLVKDGRA